MAAVAAINVRDVGDFIREQRRGAQISLRQLARQAGVSNPYLSQIERGLRRPSAEILQQIAKALRISAEVLYIQAGILEEREGGEELLAAVHGDEGLTERQKQVIVDIYDAFRRENALVASGLGRFAATTPAADTDISVDADGSADVTPETAFSPITDTPVGSDPSAAVKVPAAGGPKSGAAGARKAETTTTPRVPKPATSPATASTTASTTAPASKRTAGAPRTTRAKRPSATQAAAQQAAKQQDVSSNGTGPTTDPGAGPSNT